MDEFYEQKKKETKKISKIDRPDHIMSYFKLEKIPLIIITVSGIVYNIGMAAGPYYEGKLAQCLYEIINGIKTAKDMIILAVLYVVVILIVQGMRCFKRFYVRRFANDTSRNMRHMLYNSLIHKSKKELNDEGTGSIMTKAVADVDACAEGMRKFTTEVFDTGVVLITYIVMLFIYDWRLTLIASVFTPIAYIIADRLKKLIIRYNASYKRCEAKLADETMDRVNNGLTYRIYGREKNRYQSYQKTLDEYEKKAILANIWESTMEPVYNIISSIGVILIIYFGAKNVMHTGWTVWDIGAFTTYLACFTKMAVKSSKAAKLFNAVQKAQVSWKRIKPLMKPYVESKRIHDKVLDGDVTLKVNNVSVSYDKDGINNIFNNLSFEANKGEIIGVTGAVASGKTTFAKIFLNEVAYKGQVLINGRELKSLSDYERSMMIAYTGHEPELMSESIRENILVGDENGDALEYIRLTDMCTDIKSMEAGIDTMVGNSGARLSGGQQARVSLARALHQNSKIMILDDPFSALDKKTELVILDNIRKISKDKIVIIISHRLSIFAGFDRVIWLPGANAVNDEAIEAKTHNELMETNAEYKHLYMMQEDNKGVITNAQ